MERREAEPKDGRGLELRGRREVHGASAGRLTAQRGRYVMV